jgi:carboxyvinyl-carboxyphosphonate phosphorylmutase
MNKAKILRRLLKEPGIIVAPGAHNAFTAKIIEQTGGFQAVYMTGSGTTMSLIGQPDIGLLTMTEMVTQAKNLNMAVSLPIIADADTGYGNAINVRRTVQEYERAGLAAMHIEDQVTPKKCGHFEGKQVISLDEMAGKIRAACEARDSADSIVIIARTDARAVFGLDEALRRAHAYLDAGAEVIFVEAPQSLEELEIVAKSIKAPLMVNMDEGTKTPLLTVRELEEMGYKIVIFPRSAPCAAAKAIQELMLVLKETGTTRGFVDRIVSWEERNRITGLARYKEMEKKYLSIE